MNIDLSTSGYYQIIRIDEDLTVISDLAELRYLVKGYVSEGKRYIAVAFTNASYFYSGALAVLIECYRELAKGNGDLCIIEANENLKSIFRILKIDTILNVYDTEDDLPQPIDDDLPSSVV